MTFVRRYSDDSTVTMREIVVGGWAYVKYQDQAWQLVPQDSAHPRPESFRTALMTADCAESEPGSLQMLGDDAIAIAEALGMVDPGTTGISAEATLMLRPDGNLHRLELDFDSDVGRWAIAYAFDAAPKVDPISAPQDVVAMWQQPGAYVLLYPQDWRVESIGNEPDIFDAFTSTEGHVVVWCVPAVPSLVDWIADGAAGWVDWWGAQPTKHSTETYGSNDWQIAQWPSATFRGEKGGAIVASSFNDGLACDVAAFDPEGGDDAFFDDVRLMLRSFTFIN